MITVVTVITEKHREYVLANLELCHRLNPGLPIRWVIVDNGEASLRDDDLPCELRDNASIVSGVSIDTAFDEALGEFIRTGMPTTMAFRQLKKLRYSIHHSAGLARGIGQCTSRFLCVMDPDFFIVRADWVACLLNHIQNKKLAVIGVPWHVRWFKKTRGVPCVHFQLIDTDVLPVRPEWFGVSFDRMSRSYVSALWERRLGRGEERADASSSGPQKVREWFALVLEDIRQRKTLNATADTGSPLEDVLAGQAGLVELIPTYFDIATDTMSGPVGRLQASPLLEMFVPERYRYLPRRRYWDRWPARAPDVARLRALGEVFHWRNRLFAFHLRVHGSGGVAPAGWRTVLEEAPMAR